MAVANKDKYTPAKKKRLISKVIDGMLDGMSVNKSCIAAGVPKRTFLDWICADESLSIQYARAREIQIDTIADDVMDISDETPERIRLESEEGVTLTRIDGADVQNRRLRVDSRKWWLSKVAPKQYGDRLALQDGEGNDLLSMFASAIKDETPADGHGD